MADYLQYVRFTNLQLLRFLLLLLYTALQLLILLLHFTDFLHQFDIFFVFLFKFILRKQTINVKPELSALLPALYIEKWARRWVERAPRTFMLTASCFCFSSRRLRVSFSSVIRSSSFCSSAFSRTLCSTCSCTQPNTPHCFHWPRSQFDSHIDLCAASLPTRPSHAPAWWPPAGLHPGRQLLSCFHPSSGNRTECSLLALERRCRCSRTGRTRSRLSEGSNLARQVGQGGLLQSTLSAFGSSVKTMSIFILFVWFSSKVLISLASSCFFPRYTLSSVWTPHFTLSVRVL